MVEIVVQPAGRRLRLHRGVELLEALQASGLEIETVCGGKGTCGRCRVRMTTGAREGSTPGLDGPAMSAGEGALGGAITTAGSLAPEFPVTEADRRFFSPGELSAGFRLACRLQVMTPLTVEIPAEARRGRQRLEVESIWDGHPVSEDGHPPASPDDTPGVQAHRPDRNYRGCRGGRSSRVHQGAGPLGVAVDLGTTKMALYLEDLGGGPGGQVDGRQVDHGSRVDHGSDQGRTIDTLGMMNPQVVFGDDVISRAAYAMESPEKLKELQQTVMVTLGDGIRLLLRRNGLDLRQVSEIVIVGNTLMQHLFLGQPVDRLALSPYMPVVSDPVEVSAGELGLEAAPGARVYVAPCVAGHVGGDHLAMILASGLNRPGPSRLGIDIGTNTEIFLHAGGTMVACSCASGPAFEGMQISSGMRAAGGAIEKVAIRRTRMGEGEGDVGSGTCGKDVGLEVAVSTVDGNEPLGICGTGIVDALAGMLAAGIIDSSGYLDPANPGNRSRRHPSTGQGEFVLMEARESGTGRDLTITQKDVRQLQLAKAAIAAGIGALLREAGLAPGDLDSIILAGAFGTRLPLGSAVAIGLLPPLPFERFVQVGNAAGAGARMLLHSPALRAEAAALARKIEHLSLAELEAYGREFIMATAFPAKAYPTEK